MWRGECYYVVFFVCLPQYNLANREGDMLFSHQTATRERGRDGRVPHNSQHQQKHQPAKENRGFRMQMRLLLKRQTSDTKTMIYLGAEQNDSLLGRILMYSVMITFLENLPAFYKQAKIIQIFLLVWLSWSFCFACSLPMQV